MNEVASGLLLDRTSFAIQAIHTKTEYKQAEKRVKEREPSKSPPNLRTADKERI